MSGLNKYPKHRLEEKGGPGLWLNAVFFDPRKLNWWITVFVFLLGSTASIFVSLNRSRFLPVEFESDARTILRFARGETDEGGSFRTIANVYNTLHLTERPELAGLLGVGLATLLGILVVWRAAGIRRGIIAPGMLFMYLVFGGVFFGTYTKEILVLVVLIVIVSLAPSWAVEIVVVAAMFTIGVGFREYWLFVAAAYVVVRVLPFRWVKNRVLIPLMLVLNVAFSYGIYSFLNQPGDHFRTSVNEPRIHLDETATLIDRFVQGLPEPLGGIINNLLSLLSMAVPWPLLALKTPYYIGIFFVFAAIWLVFFMGVRDKQESNRVPVHRAISLFAAFTVVQGLFEPDYGSALRHLTPFIPFALLIWGPHVSVDFRETVPEGSDVSSTKSVAEPEGVTSNGSVHSAQGGDSVLSLTPLQSSLALRGDNILSVDNEAMSYTAVRSPATPQGGGAGVLTGEEPGTAVLQDSGKRGVARRASKPEI
ncbi:hypothetical protein [Corynebacterium auriscanis]|uniref:hypothetical protein n=1 Tax=Corynebacterium auriscanis TaxID=99807 RepID=UPI003CEEBA02